jgi:hypothetical protein
MVTRHPDIDGTVLLLSHCPSLFFFQVSAGMLFAFGLTQQYVGPAFFSLFIFMHEQM